MSLNKVSPLEAKRLIARGAVLVDIREADEHARERIHGAALLPLSRLDEKEFGAAEGDVVIFHCRSGARTLGNAGRLGAKAGGGCEAYILDGGIDAWKRAGLPVQRDPRQPMELQRQVQIGAGSFALIGTLLGFFASPWFFAIPAFVGLGLIAAGLTGFCGLARMLKLAPWNRRVYGA
jgi:rhodanese-related sulfurtransferase